MRYAEAMDAGAFSALFDDIAVAAVPHIFFEIRGADPVAFLNATTTQELGAITAGAGALTCLLDDKGHVRAELRVLARADGSVVIDCEEAARDGVAWLARVAPLSGCEVIDVGDAWRVHAVRGARATFDVPDQEHAFVERDGMLVVRVTWGLPGFDIIAPAVVDPGVVGARADASTFEAARIAAGRPRYGVDITVEHILNETPLIDRAVSFTKGCYPGQETVAKIRNLGRPRRAVVGVDAEAPLAAGDALQDDEREIGRITSAASTPLGWRGIATVRAEATSARAGDTPVKLRAL